MTVDAQTTCRPDRQLQQPSWLSVNMLLEPIVFVCRQQAQTLYEEAQVRLQECAAALEAAEAQIMSLQRLHVRLGQHHH